MGTTRTRSPLASHTITRLLYELETTVCTQRKELISVVLTIAGAYCRELERAKDDEFLACVDYYRHLLSVEADAAWWSQALRGIYSSPDHTIQAMLALLESAEQFVRQTVNAEMKPALLADIRRHNTYTLLPED